MTELSEAVEEDDAGFICDAGDPVALGEAILAAVAERGRLDEIGENCRQSMRRRYGFRASTAALRAWAASPTFAPDRDRTPTCLESMLIASVDPADAIDEAPPVADPVDDRLESDQIDPAPIDESRLQWLGRVMRTSYEDGGVGMVVKRFWSRYFAGQ